MPTIVVSINGIGQTKQISADALKRLLLAMRYVNVVTSWSDDDGVIHYPTDQMLLQEWADQIIAELNRIVELREDSLREKIPPLIK